MRQTLNQRTRELESSNKQLSLANEQLKDAEDVALVKRLVRSWNKNYVAYTVFIIQLISWFIRARPNCMLKDIYLLQFTKLEG